MAAKPTVHYPHDGITYMRGQCGQHSVSSINDLSKITCEQCRKIIKGKHNQPATA